MAIQFSGLASGLDTNAIISQLMSVERRPLDLLQQRLSTIRSLGTEFNTFRTRTTNLRSNLQKVTDARLSTSLDVFNRKSATSSNTNALSATASSAAIANTYNLEIDQLATATRATSNSVVGNMTALTSNLSAISGGSITSGKFAVFVNGTRTDITVNKDTDTLQTVANQITTLLPGASASVDSSGRLRFQFTTGTTLRFGSVNDTSNFASALFLSGGTQTAGSPDDTFLASNGTNLVNAAATLTDNDVGFQTTVTAGTFTIGTKSYTIDSSTTLESLIGKINSDNEVIASFNRLTNRLEVASRKTGAQAIVLGGASDTSNFLTASNLVVSGNSLTSQTLGQNAQFKINGQTLTSASNSAIGASTTGITGVSLDLKTTTTTPFTLTIGQNLDDATNAVRDSVTAINDVLTYIRNATRNANPDDPNSSNGPLRGQLQATSLANIIRDAMADTVGTGSLNSLATIGIQLGASTVSGSGSSAVASASTTFQFNETRFKEALQADPNAVKELLVGNADLSVKGIFQSIRETLDRALGADGLFDARSKASTSQINVINRNIAQQRTRLDRRERSLRRIYSNLESTISELRQQQSALPTA